MNALRVSVAVWNETRMQEIMDSIPDPWNRRLYKDVKPFVWPKFVRKLFHLPDPPPQRLEREDGSEAFEFKKSVFIASGGGKRCHGASRKEALDTLEYELRKEYGREVCFTFQD